MKLCPKCNHSPLPFAMIFVIAAVTGFTTWLVLGISVDDPGPRLVTSVVAALAVGGTLLHYVLSCLKRHCRHDHKDPRSRILAAHKARQLPTQDGAPAPHRRG